MKFFAYILYKMYEWRKEVKDEINDDFYVGIRLEMLWPFLIYIASRDRKKMLTIFDTFIATDDGIIEKDIYEESIKHVLSLSGLHIVTTELPYFKTLSEQYDYHQQENQDVLIYQLIDQAVDSYRKHQEQFIYLNRNVLLFYIRRHIIWQVYRNQLLPKDKLLKALSIWGATSDVKCYS